MKSLQQKHSLTALQIRIQGYFYLRPDLQPRCKNTGLANYEFYVFNCPLKNRQTS